MPAGAHAASLLTTLLAAQAAHHHPPAPAQQAPAPGYSALAFAAPAPGSYALPPLGAAADGELVSSTGEHLRLHRLYGDKLVVLSFIFTSCSDVNGCPLASFVLSQVQQRVLEDPQLRDQVRLVSLSFDPTRDTPARLESYASGFRREGFDWRFAGCESEAQLEPILAGYDQAVIRDYDADGRDLGSMSHTLRVFVVDRERRIRNIYSPAYLHPDLVLADLRTLALEAVTPPGPASSAPATKPVR
jgi:cytochrome c peroxidase